MVILVIAAAVAPSLRLSSSITALFFDPSRASGFRTLAAGLACFEAGVGVFVAAGFAPVLALGATFFWLALVVPFAGAGVTAAVPAAVLASALVMALYPFVARFGAPHASGGSAQKASGTSLIPEHCCITHALKPGSIPLRTKFAASTRISPTPKPWQRR
ncbi:MAG: hypothetical protein ACE15B_15515 [Bryobacteraceae bacterium]